MKKLIAKLLILAIFLAPATTQAFYYEGQCLVPQGKFKKCFLDFSKQKSFTLNFKDFQYSSLNREIAAKDIKHIAMGEKAQNRWAVFGPAVYFLGPLGALFILWKKKSALFSVEYGHGKNTQAVMFGVKKKLGPALSAQLKEMSGQEVHF